MKTDLLYLAHNRRRFTRQTLELLAVNTNWNLVDRIFLYDDDSMDGTSFELQDFQDWANVTGRKCELVCGTFGGPVAVMRDFLTNHDSQLFCKIDNDVALPPMWLDVAGAVMDVSPELDLLGIECMHEIRPWSQGELMYRYYEPSSHIGGIGLMRRRPFEHSLPVANGRFGFTEWQHAHPTLTRGWLRPGLPVCLLDHVPYDPWLRWSHEYLRAGWQRAWGMYGEPQRAMWEWIVNNPPVL